MKRLLVVVDMQNDFITGTLGSAAAAEILPRVKQKIDEARQNGIDVAFTRDTHGEDYLSTPEGKTLPVPHCVRGTLGHEIADGLCFDGAKVIDKPTFGSFALADYVKENGYQRAELVGICTDICVVTNALLLKTACPNAEIAVYSGLTAGTSEEAHLAAIAVMKSCQVEIL